MPGQLMQPMEGITGEDRTDWLLELDTRAVAHREALGKVAYWLRTASLVGNAAITTAQVWQRMSHPRNGDLVVEVGAMWASDLDTRLKGFGILLACRKEWGVTDEEWADWQRDEPDAYAGERPILDRVYYVQYGSKAVDICRWTNSDFLAIPITLEELP